MILIEGYKVYDLNHKNTALAEQTTTLDANFKKIGASYQAQGELFKTEQAGLLAAQDAMGKQFTDAMVQAQNKLEALYTAMGEVRSEVKTLPATKVVTDSQGDFQAAFEQVRTGPSLAKVAVTFNGPTKTLTGNWTSYKENFTTTVGEWQQKDQGYTAGIRLTRKVFRPVGDGTFTEVGTEDIPLTNATAQFGPVAFGGTQALNPVPRFTIFAGGGKDSSNNKIVPVIGCDYRLTTNLGIGTGIIGNTVFGTVSYRLGN